MRRLLMLFVFLAIALALACGGGDDDDDDSSDNGGGDDMPVAMDSSGGGGNVSSSGGSSGGGGDSDFCVPDDADFITDSLQFGPDGGDFEGQAADLLEILERWSDRAPGEIDDEVDIVVNAVRAFYELLQEYDFDFFAIAQEAENDPRFLAFDTQEFTEASDAIAVYCGFDLDPPALELQPPAGSGGSGPGTGGGGGSVTPGALPDGFPPELVPPSSEVLLSGGLGIGLNAQFRSSATVDEIRAFYDDALGPGNMIDAENFVWTSIDGTGVTSVTTSGPDGDIIIGISIVGQ